MILTLLHPYKPYRLLLIYKEYSILYNIIIVIYVI